MPHPPFLGPRSGFQVRSASTYGACVTIAAVTAALTVEGAKCLIARRHLGLPEPKVEGKALSSFLTAELRGPADIHPLGMRLGRRAGLGAYWLALNLPDAPAEALVSDEAFEAALRRQLDLLED